MDTGSTVEPGMSGNVSVMQESMSESQEDTFASEQDGSESEWVPESPTYPLNSKRAKMEQLQRIAESLGLPSSGTAVVTRQLIEGKLIEMEREMLRSSCKSQVRSPPYFQLMKVV